MITQFWGYIWDYLEMEQLIWKWNSYSNLPWKLKYGGGGIFWEQRIQSNNRVVSEKGRWHVELGKDSTKFSEFVKCGKIWVGRFWTHTFSIVEVSFYKIEDSVEETVKYQCMLFSRIMMLSISTSAMLDIMIDINIMPSHIPFIFSFWMYFLICM